jgi:hypothetical protein
VTAVHLAIGGSIGGIRRTLERDCEGGPPAVLVSYAYRQIWKGVRDTAKVRHWIMDSGAFTAHASGKPVDLQAFIDHCHHELATDPRLKAVFGLDVIGDHEASMRNVEEMVRQGIPAIPTLHITAPTEAMKEARKYPKVALGGMVGQPRSAQLAFCEQAFSVLWPKWLHAFGVTRETLLMRLPFSSCDATTWEGAPMRYGRYRSHGLKILPIRGGNRNLASEVEWYLRMEAQLKDHWYTTLKQVKETL